jgi:hypothetical protein
MSSAQTQVVTGESKIHVKIDAYQGFARRLATWLIAQDTGLRIPPRAPERVHITGRHPPVSLDLTPFAARPEPVSAAAYFAGADKLADLLEGYRAARASRPFEPDIALLDTQVHPYAHRFLDTILTRARVDFNAAAARRIARFVSRLDVYAAVKTVESLLYSRRESALLAAAETRGWAVHFDHLAIRCGTASARSARRVATLLQEHHGYVPCQLRSQRSYRFADGWRAYPLYKILENGQILRIFLDESDTGHRTQIIQHWNRVYGFTAHHLALRASRLTAAGREAIPLPDLATALASAGVRLMETTGEYTHGLLVQAFAEPGWNPEIPPEIKQTLHGMAPDLDRAIENAKLIELVSRREMAAELAAEFYPLYGLSYDRADPQSTAPIYQYFLPAQAAHVIRTSVHARWGKARATA